MSGETTEEKKHPPTDIRLQKLREQGQFAHSQELRSAVALLIALCAVLGAAGELGRALVTLLDASLRMDAMKKAALGHVVEAAKTALALAVGIPVATGLAYGVTAIVETGGLTFSPKPLTPNLKRINPVQGFAEKVKLAALVEAARSIAKTTCAIVVTAVILIFRMDDIWWSPGCGVECVANLQGRVLAELALAICAILILSGLFDLRISRALFRRRNRMTDTELKREQKDQFGAPEIVQRRREFKRDLMEGPPPLKIRDAFCVIAGKSGVVALANVSAMFSPPVLLRAASGEDAMDLLREAEESRVPRIDNDEAVAALLQCPRGKAIPEATFELVARCLPTAKHGR